MDDMETGNSPAILELRNQLRMCQEELKNYIQELDYKDLQLQKNYNEFLFEKELMKSENKILE